MEDDALFEASLKSFVEARKALAAQLRAAKRADAVKRVLATPKPSPGAWALNQIARKEPEVLRAYLDAHDALASAQVQSSGREQIFATSHAERTAKKTLVDHALARLEADGTRPSKAVMDSLPTTLHAAAMDPTQRNVLLAGRLLGDVEAADFGTLALLAASQGLSGLSAKPADEAAPAAAATASEETASEETASEETASEETASEETEKPAPPSVAKPHLRVVGSKVVGAKDERADPKREAAREAKEREEREREAKEREAKEREAKEREQREREAREREERRAKLLHAVEVTRMAREQVAATLRGARGELSKARSALEAARALVATAEAAVETHAASVASSEAALLDAEARSDEAAEALAAAR